MHIHRRTLVTHRACHLVDDVHRLLTLLIAATIDELSGALHVSAKCLDRKKILLLAAQISLLGVIGVNELHQMPVNLLGKRPLVNIRSLEVGEVIGDALDCLDFSEILIDVVKLLDHHLERRISRAHILLVAGKVLRP